MMDANDQITDAAVVIALEKAIKDHQHWMASQGYSQGTKRIYRWRLTQFLALIKSGNYGWHDIFTPTTLKRFKGPAHAVTNLSRYLCEQGKIDEPLGHQKPSAPLPGEFEDYLRYRRKVHQTPARSIKTSRRVLSAFARHLERHGIQLQALGIEHIDAFVKDYLQGLSMGSCRHYRWHLRGFLRYLFGERRLLSKDLAPLVTGPPMFARSKPPKFLRQDEIKKLFAALQYTTASELRTAAVIHLAFMLGLRPCEIRLLKLDDVSFGKAEVYLRRRKNNRPNKLPLPDAAIKAIAAYLVGGRAESKHRALFLTLRPPYRPLSANAVNLCIRNCMRSVGLDASAYWLRHTYAQNLLEAGASIYEVKEMLGHDSIESTRKYLNIHIELMRKVLFDETL
ncbi:MAG: tyrosine-type recombinase/integrase [Desulfobacteraceae bacterium]|jgi:site-specific recombinase XerD